MKKILLVFSRFFSVVILIATILVLSACSKTDKGYQKNEDLDTSKEVVLKMAGNKETWAEMETIIAKFEKIYPNCTINYEFIENYTANIAIRLKQDEDKIDIFKTTNIQSENLIVNNVLNLKSAESKKILDLSQCNEGLIKNFMLAQTDKLYAIPLGGEMRGMYVNVSLLKKFDLKVPTNRSELLHCCEVLKEAGYIPFQSSVGTFAQQLLYPYICNSIVNGGNYEEMYNSINNIDEGISEYFREPLAFLYDIVSKGYYDYKKSETELGYQFSSSDLKAKDFLNIKKISDDIYERQDGVGNIAFLPDAQSFELYLEKNKEDYHTTIEYEFIVSPVGEDGGYAYLSPDNGLAVNKDSDNTDWSLEFLNFFFTPENNKEYANLSGVIPNAKDALVQYNISADHTSTVGQVTFQYSFYDVITKLMGAGYDDTMVGISKMNAQKYMIDNGDGTYSFKLSLDDYMARLEQQFQTVKEGLK